MKICGIYCIKNIKNNKVYIGSSSNMKYRWSRHKSDLNCNRHDNKHLQNSWNKYGENNFIFISLEEIEGDKLTEREQFYIDKYNSMDIKFGYNKREASNNGSPSEETKRKMSISARNRPKISEETKKKISENNKKMWASGKMSNVVKANKEKRVSQETRDKISKSLMGRKRPLEVGKKSGDTQRGKKLSEETKAKMREAQKLRRMREKGSI
ncbi:homing endonuclease [Bacillus phage G]|uniref:Gp595 n=1 Tax=Bacillus phage G TaxID=2884420 RepID=G3MAX5_9CAUD|nr:homing endonuclease [Bacillus phage G]AEO93840.1 gp595 [Bacillus phage G]